MVYFICRIYSNVCIVIPYVFLSQNRNKKESTITARRVSAHNNNK